MNCGEMILVRDFYGANAMRFLAQCGGRFVLITNGLDHLNGYMITDWRGVLRELIAKAVPAKLTERTMMAESTATSLYVGFPLTYPLSALNFANLLGVPAEDVRAQLADLAVQTDD